MNLKQGSLSYIEKHNLGPECVELVNEVYEKVLSFAAIFTEWATVQERELKIHSFDCSDECKWALKKAIFPQQSWEIPESLTADKNQILQYLTLILRKQFFYGY